MHLNDDTKFHVFTDAYDRGFAAVVYACRATDQTESSVDVSVVLAKARVAPVARVEAERVATATARWPSIS